jgi:hypothetical protein
MKMVVLTGQEMITAATIGVRRHVFALCSQLRPTDGAEANGDGRAFDHHIIGAMAEFAVAKELNFFWSPNIGLVKKGDVGSSIEVRARRKNGSGLDLVLKPADDDDRIYVLVHCAAPVFEIMGWLRGREGKNASFAQWNDQRNIWFIPVSELHDVAELKV